MRSVTLSELESIVERKEICILNMTRLAVDFVSSLVNHSPGNIATKQDNKQLPLELWGEIIAWVEMDLKSSNYYLVQVQSLEEHGASRILSCAKIIERNRCGLLKLEDDVDEYRKYLRCPGEGDDPKRPFVLPDTSNSDSLIRIKESLLLPENQILFYRLHVYDVIARIEHGDCSLCERQRWVDCYEHFMFYGYAHSAPKYWLRSVDPTMGCPLCIGLGSLPRDYWPRILLSDGNEEEPKRVKTYDEHLRERFEELGYDWVPSYFWGLG